MQSANLALSRRLERAEGYACAQFATARRRLFPDSGAEWMECAGAYAVYDGIDSPVTQSFGLGVSEELHPDALDAIEHFFFQHGAPAQHEVSPFAGVTVLNLLCARNYRLTELSNVLFREVEEPEIEADPRVKVRVISPGEAQLWSDISARGWAHEHPELLDFLAQLGAISALREQTFCFLAEFDGEPGAAGALSLHEGVAAFAGSATIPELRRRGLQTALLHERMRYASEHGCDVAMMAAQPGSGSQRNAERKGFRIAYTRTKWRLESSAGS